MSDELRNALNNALCDELAAALGRIAHCVGQLTDDQVWSRPAPPMNSIGNLMLHLAGNVRQLIAAGVGGEPDIRDRQSEFDARGPIPADELLGKLLLIVKRAREVIVSASDESLRAMIPIKRYDLNGIEAIIRCIAHFRGHTQEIIHMTRMFLGEKYEFAGPS
jgi:Protein of unknown function (DUF1572)